MKIKNALILLVYCLISTLIYGENGNAPVLLEKDEATESYISHFFVSEQKEIYDEINRTQTSFDWFFVVLFLFLTLLAFLRLQNPNIFLLLRQVLSRKKQRDAFSRRESSSKNFLFFLLIICSWLGFSLAFTEILSFFDFAFPFEPLFFAFIFLFCYAFLKYLLRKMAIQLFQIGDIIAEHRQMAIPANFVGILIIFPLATINHYAANDYLIWVICILFCVNFLQKFFFAWIIFPKKMRIFEILLYLCTIEILPLLLFARYIINYL